VDTEISNACRFVANQVFDAVFITVVSNFHDANVFDNRELAVPDYFNVDDGLDHPVLRFDAMHHACALNRRNTATRVADPD